MNNNSHLGRNYPRVPSRFKREGEPFPNSSWARERRWHRFVEWLVVVIVAAIGWLGVVLLFSLA